MKNVGERRGILTQPEKRGDGRSTARVLAQAQGAASGQVAWHRLGRRGTAARWWDWEAALSDDRSSERQGHGDDSWTWGGGASFSAWEREGAMDGFYRGWRLGKMEG
ncbi:hypothetical protein GUJ93_ZPchr0012g21547 [Zizania palustris]|uniref:Uncharacterized protein n=1 Tax=Zizania palustris TaxID=103762 RepID=A0A8J6BZD4_ZIZPA|nr:hypothetical protein GUJ93_ZPchr0012g21547 [Zizania palustris]